MGLEAYILGEGAFFTYLAHDGVCIVPIYIGEKRAGICRNNTYVQMT